MLDEETLARMNGKYVCPPDAGPAWCAAMEYGFDMSIVEVTGVGQYEQVRQRSIPHRLSYGEFQILELDALIAAKSAVGRAIDLGMVKLLQAIKEKNAQQKGLFPPPSQS